MRFQVPQFIEVEDKIFGSLTLKQFIYLAGGGGLSFLVYFFLNNIYLAFIPIVVIMSLSAALGFYKLYKRIDLVSVLESAFKYYIGNKLYIWKKTEKVASKNSEKAFDDTNNYASIMVPKISDSKLKDLTWSLDIKESMYSNKNQK